MVLRPPTTLARDGEGLAAGHAVSKHTEPPPTSPLPITHTSLHFFPSPCQPFIAGTLAAHTRLHQMHSPGTTTRLCLRCPPGTRVRGPCVAAEGRPSHGAHPPPSPTAHLSTCQIPSPRLPICGASPRTLPLRRHRASHILTLPTGVPAELRTLVCFSAPLSEPACIAFATCRHPSPAMDQHGFTEQLSRQCLDAHLSQRNPCSVLGQFACPCSSTMPTRQRCRSLQKPVPGPQAVLLEHWVRPRQPEAEPGLVRTQRGRLESVDLNIL